MKNKNDPKIEQVFKGSSSGEPVSNEQKSEQEISKSEVDFVLEKNLTEEEKKENEKLDEEKQKAKEPVIDEEKQQNISNVQSKISKILKDANIEIVDENIGDEYVEISDSEKKSKQDYETLKALFGDSGKNKKTEIILEVDDFDYTNIGKYIDDFDLMHVKDIKHIKLRKKVSGKQKGTLIAALILIIVGLPLAIGLIKSNNAPITIQNVSISQTISTSDYYVGDYFSFDGLYLNVKYSNGTIKNIKLNDSYLAGQPVGMIDCSNNAYKFTGVSDKNVVMTFNYSGFQVQYEVVVKEKVLKGIYAEFPDNINNLKKDNILVVFDYGEYGKVLCKDKSNVIINIDENIIKIQYQIFEVSYQISGKTITKVQN